MKVSQVNINCYGSTPSGSITIYDSNNTIVSNITEEEAHRIFSLALDIFQSKQHTIAETIKTMQPLVLSAPVAEADFDEVPF